MKTFQLEMCTGFINTGTEINGVPKIFLFFIASNDSAKLN